MIAIILCQARKLPEAAKSGKFSLRVGEEIPEYAYHTCRKRIGHGGRHRTQRVLGFKNQVTWKGGLK